MGRFVAVILIISSACTDEGPTGTTYYERNVEPILANTCEGATAPCHRDDGAGNALGNLDVSSFEAIQQRRDVLQRFGSYPEPLLLMKAVSSNNMNVAYEGEFLPMENPHAVGAIIDPASEAYFTLKAWLDNGATENGLPPPNQGAIGDGSCNEALLPEINLAMIPDDAPGLAEFGSINAYLVESCGAGSCHGTPEADLYFSCGTSDDQRKLNYWMARAFVAGDVDDSELMVRPLDPRMGGIHHTGGVFYPTRDDAQYQQLRTWADTAGPLPPPASSPARDFFEGNVMPVLLKRGCALQACHSPIIPHKLRLRAGSNGFFSQISDNRNYKEVHKGFVALGSPNPLVSRLVAKNMIGPNGGIPHRAGALLETPGASADPAACPSPYDPVNASALCTIAEWLRLERSELDPRYVANLSSGATLPLVYVERPAESARMIDFSEHRPGADLLRATATLGAAQSVASAAGSTSLLSSCPGVSGNDRTQIDVRGPEASSDGLRILFAMRTSASGGMDIYEVNVDGTNCRKVTQDGGTQVRGITVNNFDPYYVIDNSGIEWLVYASTRAGIRTPKFLLPGSDLWRQRLDGTGAAEQMTWLRGVERHPAIMGNGQLIMSKEKATNDFYQLSGRRINWDLSDYHPLLGNRHSNFQGRGGYLPGTEPGDAVLRPSIGYGQATEIRQALDGDFLVVLADRNTWGQGGALGIFNRSIGPFEAGRNDPAFVKALTILPGPTGRAGEATGAYRSPFPLPNGSILASYASGVDIAQASATNYDLVIVSPRTGQRMPLISGGGSQVEAILVYARPPPHPLTLPQTGYGGVTETTALVHFPDLPLLATILDSNNRRGRDATPLREATQVRFFAHAAPPADCTTTSSASCASNFAGPESVYEARSDLGTTDIHDDGSVYAWVPAKQPLLFEMLDSSGNVLFRLREEFQFGPNENIGIGVPARSFNTMCAGCHGSIDGRELDVVVVPDAVTSASETTARSAEPVSLQ